MQRININGQVFEIVSRKEGSEGRNTIVFLKKPKGRILHIASEHAQNGKVFYSEATALHGFRA